MESNDDKITPNPPLPKGAKLIIGVKVEMWNLPDGEERFIIGASEIDPLAIMALLARALNRTHEKAHSEGVCAKLHEMMAFDLLLKEGEALKH